GQKRLRETLSKRRRFRNEFRHTRTFVRSFSNTLSPESAHEAESGPVRCAGFLARVVSAPAPYFQAFTDREDFNRAEAAVGSKLRRTICQGLLVPECLLYLPKSAAEMVFIPGRQNHPAGWACQEVHHGLASRGSAYGELVCTQREYRDLRAYGGLFCLIKM